MVSSSALLTLGVTFPRPVLIATTPKAQTILLDDFNPPVFDGLLGEVAALRNLVRVRIAVLLKDFSPPSPLWVVVCRFLFLLSLEPLP